MKFLIIADGVSGATYIDAANKLDAVSKAVAGNGVDCPEVDGSVAVDGKTINIKIYPLPEVS